MGGNSFSIHTPIDVEVGCNITRCGGKIVLTYDDSYSEDSSSHTFGFHDNGSGYQAWFRANRGKKVIGQNFGTIPYHVYEQLGWPSYYTSEDVYRVEFSTGGQDIAKYFTSYNSSSSSSSSSENSLDVDDEY